jgi:hypothetical protein
MLNIAIWLHTIWLKHLKDEPRIMDPAYIRYKVTMSMSSKSSRVTPKTVNKYKTTIIHHGTLAGFYLLFWVFWELLQAGAPKVWAGLKNSISRLRLYKYILDPHRSSKYLEKWANNGYNGYYT